MAALEWRGWGLSGPPIEVPTDSKEPLRPKTEPGAGDTALAAAGGTGPLDAAAANLPPPPTAAPEVVAAVQDWIDKKFLPALNHTVRHCKLCVMPALYHTTPRVYQHLFAPQKQASAHISPTR